MSAREYRSIKMALRTLLRSYAGDIANKIFPLMKEQEKYSRDSEQWFGLCYQINVHYDNYTDLVNVLYPECEREIGDWVQVLDEIVGKLIIEDRLAQNG